MSRGALSAKPSPGPPAQAGHVAAMVAAAASAGRPSSPGPALPAAAQRRNAPPPPFRQATEAISRARQPVAAAGGVARALQPKKTFTEPGGDVDAKGAKGIVKEFLRFAKAKNRDLADIIRASETLDNFELNFDAQVKPDGEQTYQGKTEILVETAGKSWKYLSALGKDWATLPKPANVKMVIKFMFNQGQEDDRERQFYILLHEMIIHAVEYWPVVKDLILGKERAYPSDDLSVGGHLHADTHHFHLGNRSNPAYEDLLTEGWSHIMGLELNEMFALSKEKKPMSGRKWHGDYFLAVHQEDVVTQLVDPILRYWDEKYEPIKEAFDDLPEIELKSLRISTAKSLDRSIGELLTAIVKAAKGIKKEARLGWRKLRGGLGDRLEWSGQAAENLEATIGLLDLYISELQKMQLKAQQVAAG